MKKTPLFSQLFAIMLAVGIMSPSLGWMIPSTQANFEPYQKTFVVTAYYSPLPGQQFYVTGSLASDKRLNGNGTHGADGTPVYPGMIAAPSIYSFGTRISCPGYIDGEVHDRGGAIVKAGQRGYAHDRLDFWAGHGDEALKTALYWGKRTLTCTVYPPGYSGEFQQYVSLPNAPIKYGVAERVKQTSKPYLQAAANASVSKKYSNLLKELGYDPEDKASRVAFQLRHDIIDSPEEAVAGNIGPATKAKLDEISAAMASAAPAQGLELGQVSAEVRALQELLYEQGYLSAEPTAIFGDQTKAALIAFQLDKDLIDSADHPAAGYVGPGTEKAFQENMRSQFEISETDRSLIAELNKDQTVAASLAKADALEETETAEEEQLTTDEELEALIQSLSEEWIKTHTPLQNSSSNQIQLASATTLAPEVLALKKKLAPVLNPFDEHLSLGSTGEDVRKTQELLQELGFFDGQVITDYFGQQTQQAVVDFQIEYGIIEHIWSPGAGIVGPKTMIALNASYYQQEFSLPQESGDTFRAPAINPKDLYPDSPLQQASTAQHG